MNKKIGVIGKTKKSEGGSISFKASKEALVKEEFSIEIRDNWKDIIFLPFKTMWRILLMISIVINAIWYGYILVYKNQEDEYEFYTVIYLPEAIFFLDTILYIMHRNMPQHRKRKMYFPRNLFQVVYDCLTLIPIQEIYVFLRDTSHTKKKSKYMKFTKVLTITRCYRVIHYFGLLRNTAGLHQVVVITMGHIFHTILWANILAAVWYFIACYQCDTKNWTINLTDVVFDPQNSVHWYILCFTCTLNKITHNTPGVIRSENEWEGLFDGGIILIGFIAHVMFFNGQLIVAYIKILKTRYKYFARLLALKNLMIDWKIDNETYERAVNFFKAIWTHRCGYRKTPALFYELPRSIQKEAKLDIFYEALRHSHVFVNEDLAFKRALSLRMKNRSYLPGDYVYKYNELKFMMCYILSGIVQILSDEDDESPVISFSAGTLLGEVCTIMPCISTCNVRCATYCEVQTLAFVDLHRILLLYPPKSRPILDQLHSRLKFAKVLKNFKDLTKDTRESDLSDIKWIKTRWRLLYELTCDLPTKFDRIFEEEIAVEHCSNFLDLLVLSEDVELKMTAICLTSKFPLVLDPDSSFKKAWEIVSICNILAIYLPFFMCWKRELDIDSHTVCILCDVMNFMDLMFKVTTAIKMKHALIIKPSKIIVKRFKSPAFLVDVIAFVPADYIGVAIGLSKRLIPLLKVNRLLRIYKPFVYLRSNQKRATSNTFIYTFLKYWFLYMLMLYWLACITWISTCYDIECVSKGWLRGSTIGSVNNLYAAYSDQILTALFYVICSAMSLGLTSRHQLILVDVIETCIIVYIGYILFSFCVSEICAYCVHSIRPKMKHCENIERTAWYMIHVAKMPLGLRNKITKYIIFQWNYNENADVMGATGLVKSLPRDLRKRVFLDRIVQYLKLCPIFYEFDDYMMRCLAQLGTVKVLPPGVVIQNVECKATDLYIVMRGSCKMYSFMTGDKERKATKILESGNAFPLLEVLHDVWSFLRVESITAVEILSIPLSEINKISKMNADYYDAISDVVRDHRKKYMTLLDRVGGKLPEMYAQERILWQADMFDYKMEDEDKAKAKTSDDVASNLQSGKWSLVRYILFKTTLSPKGKFFIGWEINRCIFACLDLIMFNLSYNILNDWEDITDYLYAFFKISGLVDIYIRMHLQYYNDDGILVTHPLMTAKYYLGTSFIIDVIGNFPVHFIGLHYWAASRWYDFVKILVGSVSLVQLYRIDGIVNYIQEKLPWKRAMQLQSIKYLLFIILAALFIANTQAFYICQQPLGDALYMECGNKSWVDYSHMKDAITPWQLYVQCYYIVVVCLTATHTGAFRTANIFEVGINTTVFLIGFLIRIFFLCSMCSAGIVGNEKLTIFRENVDAFRKFIRNELIDETIIKTTISHYEHEWRSTQGWSMHELYEKLHPNLRKDLTSQLYGPTLRGVELFSGAEESFYQVMAVHLTQLHVKKDSDIIRLNDVQNMVFIVYRGMVEVKVANATVGILKTGGIFGNFSRQPMKRQKIAATANVHTVVLSISSICFHKIIKDYPVVLSRVNKVNLYGYEFVESYMSLDKNTIFLLTSQKSFHRSLAKITDRLHEAIERETFWYTFITYILNVHLACISSLFHLHMTIVYLEKLNNFKSTFRYTIDVIYFLKMIIGMHIAYVDTESGLLVHDLRRIRKRYFKEVLWLDIVSIAPLEILVQMFTSNIYIINYACMNRAFRFFFITIYYDHNKNNISVSNTFRWFYVAYCVFFLVELTICCWWLIACLEGKCKYMVDWHYNNTVTEADSFRYSQVLAFLYAANILTMSSMKIVVPVTLTQIFITIIISFSVLYISVVLTSSFASALVTVHHTMTQFEYKIFEVIQYVKNRELSPALITKFWEYFLGLWTHQSGQLIPALIAYAPPHLKQDIMIPLYGKYVEQHFLFSKTHIDFIRQLVIKLERSVYFPGYFIVEKGDVDGSMYFIHSGEVLQIEVMGKNEIPQKTLTKGTSFGEASGLFNVPHKQSFRAVTPVDVLHLNLKKWEYLLQFFPASKEEIFLRAAENGIKPPRNIRDANTYY